MPITGRVPGVVIAWSSTTLWPRLVEQTFNSNMPRYEILITNLARAYSRSQAKVLAARVRHPPTFSSSSSLLLTLNGEHIWPQITELITLKWQYLTRRPTFAHPVRQGMVLRFPRIDDRHTRGHKGFGIACRHGKSMHSSDGGNLRVCHGDNTATSPGMVD